MNPFNRPSLQPAAILFALLVAILIYVFFGCSKIDMNKFTDVDKKYIKLKSSIDLGINYIEYCSQVRDFKTEIEYIKPDNDKEKDYLLNYKILLEYYIDAMTIWGVKFNGKKSIIYPSYYIANQIPEALNIIKRYELKSEIISDGITIIIPDELVSTIWRKCNEKKEQLFITH